MRKKHIPKYLILDVDGVITDGTMIYDTKGKRFKIFGPDDHDSLKILKKYMKIYFVRKDFKYQKKELQIWALKYLMYLQWIELIGLKKNLVY